jgi:hypothetical protein
MFSSVIGLVACGGGGGGGGGGASYVRPESSPPIVPPVSPPTGPTGPTYLHSTVPYATPQLVDTITPMNSQYNPEWLGRTYTANISGSNSNDVIVAGGASNPTGNVIGVNDPNKIANFPTSNIGMLSWKNGNLVDTTAQWFPNNSNIILASPSIKFASFNNNGLTDMVVAPGTDVNGLYGPAYVYFNRGTYFNRYTIPLNNVYAHDVAVGDLFGSGYKDIVFTDFGPNTTIAVNNKNSTFTTYTQAPGSCVICGESSIAVGDFLNNKTVTMVATDTDLQHNTALYSFSINAGTGYATFNRLSTLPTPIFEQAQWATIAPNGSHNMRVLPFDFVGNGITDVLVMSSPQAVNGTWPTYSALQFLKNDGNGNFTDVTNDILVGYNNKSAPTYNINFIDLLGNGQKDIVLGSAADFNNGAGQILIKASNGQYVSSYANILSDFASQTLAIQKANTPNAFVPNGNHDVNIIKDPTGNLYLITYIDYYDNTNTQKLGVYLSKIGPQGVTSPVDVATAIKNQWPWMSPAQVNTVLANTAGAYLNGAIIDPEAALNPVGGLNISTAKGMSAITGYITGVNFGADTTVTAMDSLNRSFSINLQPLIQQQAQNSFNMDSEHIDQYDLTSHTEYLINGAVNTYGSFRVGTETRNMYNTLGSDASVGPTLSSIRNYTVGVPRLWSNGNWSAGAQYTTLNYNPWLSFGGAWGMVTQTGNLDTAVRYNHSNGFTAVVGTTYTTTQLMPGLVNKVNDIYGVWAETGYRSGNFGVYAGVKPVVVSGSIQANLPTGIDNAGNMQYTGRSLAIQNQTTGYARALWTADLNKHTAYRVSGTAMTNGQYRLMNELRFTFD